MLFQIYVGAKETASTCNTFNSTKEPEVITKSTPTQQVSDRFYTIL